MKYALVNGVKLEASPTLKGFCPHCESELIPKCGNVMIWHWSHRPKSDCDFWWENETIWHREWKNCFPSQWQEVSDKDNKTGEKHIADVKTPFGLVIEFQHSYIKYEERTSRENFYKNMIWVIDGCRNELDKGHFNVGLSGPIQDSPIAFKINWYGKSRLLHDWGKSQVKVFFDFGEDIIWRLVLYDNVKKIGAVGPIPKKTFIEDCLNGDKIRVSEFRKE